ncbi:hypothetical protein Q8W40_06220 [Vibrio penaeicida]|uniref:hypothetical protein n=1 Tax=Vibrio penaeicida TaxID=104609 RepID=UPI002733ECD2|nr:hypothetical protein [Vibrio penaeicida]MDP2571765.1 hypothetical protein [Vibrio penaeicida]
MKHLFLIAICLLITACTSPYSPPEMEKTATFEGLMTNKTNSISYRTIIVMVHGMCEKPSDWARKPINSIVEKAGYHGPVEEKDLGYYFPNGSTSTGFPYLREYEVSDEKSELKFYAYHYSDWNQIRNSGELDIQGKSAYLNKKVKDTLVSGCFSDVTTYAGSKGIKIREYLAKSMAKVQEMNPESSTIKNRIFFISSSLGSKVLRDVLMCAPHPSQHSDYTVNQSITKSLMAQSSTVFMASNQIPLLSPLNNCKPIKTNRSAKTEQEEFYSNSLAAALSDSIESKQNGGSKINVVAYTDPSDLLSYPVSNYGTTATSSNSQVTVHNVKVSNTSTWFWFVTNALESHMGYLSNPDVIASMICGSDGCQ